MKYAAPTWSRVGLAGHPSRPPTLMSKEKGMKNFTDAASQSQYRTAARFFLSASVNAHIAAAKTVDCQRWFANGERSACVIAIGPFRKASGEPSRLPLCPPG